MTDRGVLIVNVFDRSAKHDLLDAMGATMCQVFPSLERLSRPDGNHIVFAFAEKRTLSETVLQLKNGAGPEWVRELSKKSAQEMAEFEPKPGAVIFTDDKAPIEQMTRRMLAESNK